MLKILKKSTALLLTVLMILNLFLVMPVFAGTPETVAAWDYTAAPGTAVVPATSGINMTGAVLANFKNAAPDYSSGSLRVNGGWDNGADSKYWQISFSSKGYENLTISAKTRSSGTGPRDFKLVYSIDNGLSWKDIPNSTYAMTSTSLANFMPTVTLPEDAANCDVLQIRFIMASNISQRAGTGYPADETVASGGTSNINNIIVMGTPSAGSPDTLAPMIAHSPVIAGNSGMDLEIKALVTDNVVVSSVKLYYRTAAQIDYKQLDMILSNGEYTAAIPKTDLDSAGLEYYIWASDGINTATVPADISIPYAVSISAADVTEPEITNLIPASGTSTKANLRPMISAEYSDLSSIDETSVKLLVDGIDVTSDATITASQVSYIPSVDLSAGTHTARVEVADVSQNKAITEWNFNVGEPVYNLYFGQLHSHTTNSDGIGSLDEAFSHAKNDAKLDFFAVTDHSNSLDNAATATITNGSASTKWVSGRAAALRYTDPDFAGIYGYEMTWSNNTGHINTFNTAGFENRGNALYTGVDGLKNYFNALKLVPSSISQFNHPGSTFGDFNDFASYDTVVDKNITLIEVGNGEGQVRGSGYFPSYEYYTRALDKGWHLAPTNNQDNHLGNWGDSNTARTVLLAESLTTDRVYDAMQNRRAYATEDNNLHINYTLNGDVMGTILDQKPGNVNIKVDIADPDNEALGTISVISNGGRVVTSKPLATGTDSVEFLLPPDYSYYYIRIDQADQDIAVTAPVWIGEVDKAGIAKTTINTTMPVKGESLKIISSLYNNESAPMIIKTLDYSIDGNVINTASAQSTVDSFSTGSYSFDWTPTFAGNYNIDVRLTVDLGGVEKVYTDVLKLKVDDPAFVTKVLVDGSHFNDYVAGYYANNMSNLTKLALGEKISVIIQKDPLTDIALANVQLLILSPPAKKSSTANGVSYAASPYTVEEIAVIKRFADRGGNIIITALADYQDSRTDTVNHSAYQQNQILSAIGATSRINDDEVIDYDNNPNVNPPGVAGGTPYRIPMSVYNMESPYLSGVTAGQLYSFYSGCSITMGSNAAWLVNGYSTTYGFDSDNDKLGGSFVSAANKAIPADTGIGKGNVVALAMETLPGGGKLFVGGTVFFSDFEIKVTLDNYAQFQNSNYNITMNILDSIKKVIPVTDINVIRAGNIGDAFCAEGIATAGTESGNAFFDTIYIQDATGGINIFPVSDMDIKVGQKVKVTGTLDEYQGEKELRAITDCVIITDSNIAPVNPKELSTGDSMLVENGGWLVKIQGKVTSMEGNSLFVDDGTGIARVFVDGYIGDGTGNTETLGKWDTNIKVGDLVGAIGIASVDTEGSRLRVRNTAEIVRLTVDVTGLELMKENTTIKLGESETLTAVVFPDDATNRNLVWTSSDSSVATVADGKVSGQKLGTATITVRTEDGLFSDACKVLVVETPVTGVKIINDKKVLKVGKTKKLIAKVFPSDATVQNAFWTSSDPSVATVANGLVTGLKAGTVDITVTTEDGSFTSTCTIIIDDKRPE